MSVPIAIVGMAALFPGAADLDAYWANIVAGHDAITEVPPDRWDPTVFGAAPEEPPGPDRFACRRGGFVGAVAFDAEAFGIMPVAVDDAEPDQLVCLQLAAAALEDAGGADRALGDRQRVGVVLGRGGYLTPGLARIDQRVRTANQVAAVLRDVVPGLDADAVDAVRRAIQDRLGPARPEASIGLVPNLAARRLANRLDLGGPAYTVDGACASSLLAVDQAVRELRSGRCDVVLAGGTHHCHDVTLWSVFTQLGALSRRQQIRPFHREADGLLIGEGSGIVVLKRLDDAERDGDRVYASIRGVGVASDGRDASLMKPKVAGQVLALQRAWADIDDPSVAPASIGLVEAHGTATRAGDDAELATLSAFFGPAEGAERAGLGSVKSMIGHAMPAAGVAGLIKAAMAVHHGVLPPTLHAEDPTPALAGTRFRLVETAEPWDTPAGGTRRAAVDAFGFGGINAHVVLDATGRGARAVDPLPPVASRLDPAAEPILLLAAPTVADLAAQLDAPDAALLAGIGAAPAPDGAVRLALVAPDAKRLALARRVVAQGKRWHGRSDLWFSPAPRLGAGGGALAVAFPGVEPVFDPRVDDVAAWFGWPSPDLARADEHLGAKGRAIVDVGRLLFRALGEVGITPDLVFGHSIGEWTAMVASELIPPADVEVFVDGIHPEDLRVPGVAFAAMGCSAEQAAALIADEPGVVVSHDNCPHQSIVCGDGEAVRAVLARARDAKVLGQELTFESGFHTPMLGPYLDQFHHHVDRMPLQAPTVPLWSATTAAPYPTDPDGVRELTVRHLLEPVRFRVLLERLRDAGVQAVIQAGVGSLVAFCDDTFAGDPLLAIPATTPKRPGLAQLRRVAAAVWAEGQDGVRFDRLAHRPGRGRPLGFGAPLVSLAGLELSHQPGPVPAGAAGPDPRLADLRASADPVLAELGAVLAETRDAGEAVLAVLGDRAAPASSPLPPPAPPTPPSEHRGEIEVSLTAMPWLIDHCFYRQPDGWPDDADRFPVLPMTATLGVLVEQAGALVHDLVPVGVSDVRALRWIGAAPPTTLAVRATRHDAGRGTVDVRVVLDGYARGTVHFAPAFPAAPPASERGLANERDSDVPAVDLYAERWMFHGPAYQGIAELGPVADDGIRGVIVSPDTPGALLDNAGQLMGYWVMQREELDRLALPMAVTAIEWFGPAPAAGEPVPCTVWIDEHTDDAVTASMELLDADGAVWCRIRGWTDKRFDSDEVVWPLLRFPERASLAEVHGPWVLVRERWRSSASRELMARRYTDAVERAAYEARNPREQRHWLLGRIAAKEAVRAVLPEGTFPVEVGIGHDGRGRPVVTRPEAASDRSISLAHTDWLAVAMVGRPGGPAVGIDVERVEPRAPHFAAFTLTEQERRLVQGEPGDHDLVLTRCWAVKEAAAKAEGTGLEGRPTRFEIDRIDGTRHRVGTRWIDTTTITTTEGEFVVAWTNDR